MACKAWGEVVDNVNVFSSHMSFHRMDSFFLAEMFKYLFLLFAEAEDLPFDIEDYVFTTEAHLLPLSLSMTPHSSSIPSNRTAIHQSEEEQDDSNFDWICPNTRLLFPDPAFPRSLREPIRSVVDKSCPRRPAPFRFVHIEVLTLKSAACLMIRSSSSTSSFQGARYGSSSSEGSGLHGKQPWTFRVAEEDGSQSHPPEGWQGAVGPACYAGTTNSHQT